eukprot:11708250-Karenia_brevis.AAC.1
MVTNDKCPDRLRSQRVFQHMLQTMGGKGILYLYSTVEDKVSRKRTADDAEHRPAKKDSRDLIRIEEGYAYMR